MHTGSIVDFYDDPSGTILKEKVAHAELPEYVKTAQYLTDDDRAQLPDDVFALVAVDQGEKLRKFACVDRGNTALSVIYFMENQNKLPEEAQKVAAANLLTACEWHDLQPPMQLHKVARPLKRTWQKFKAGWKRHALGKRKGRQEKKKQGDVSGTEIMPHSVDRSEADATAGESTKMAALRPYVDITGRRPAPRFEKRAHQNFCLVKQGEGKFPIDDYGQVMDASRWFGDHGTSLHPEDRREYCTKLAARADQLGIMVPDKIRKYAGQDFAPDGEVKVAVCGRMQFWADDAPERDMLQGLMDKYASVTPDVFCESLRQFDEATGMDHLWDDAIYDPWYSTYGFTKEATWSWTYGNDRITEEDLRRGVHESIEALQKRFGEELAQSLDKKPREIFDSLPLDHKRIIAKIIMDQQ